jgi:hypothetical protein
LERHKSGTAERERNSLFSSFHRIEAKTRTMRGWPSAERAARLNLRPRVKQITRGLTVGALIRGTSAIGTGSMKTSVQSTGNVRMFFTCTRYSFRCRHLTVPCHRHVIFCEETRI